MARPPGPWLTKDDVMQCRDCQQIVPITDFYLIKGSSARWNKYKRRWAKCKLCCDAYHKPYQVKYDSKPEVKLMKRMALKRLRAEVGRCRVCTGRYSLNSSKQCKPCYIRLWLERALVKIKITDWYKQLPYEQQFGIIQRYEFARSITGKADIANKTFASHWPHEGLYQIVRPSKNPSLSFTIDNIGWKRKTSRG